MKDYDFLFPRQYLLTPVACSFFNEWQHLHIGNYHLYAHPDLQLSTVVQKEANITLILLGYIIDPHCPECSDTDILRVIAGHANSIEKISNHISTLTGRFVLIIRMAEETYMFHDPCGLRRVCYTRHGDSILAGSQPYIFTAIKHIQMGRRYLDYTTSPYVKKTLEDWIPANYSLFEDTHYLVANHYLCISTLEQVRYWPRKKIAQNSSEVVVTKAAELLRKLMVAANSRFKLALPLTGGWDSRLLLGASKDISEELYFYTLQYRDLNAKSSDIRIPRELLKSLGLQHHLIDCRKSIPESFREMYNGNSPLAHLNDWGYMAYAMLKDYPLDRVYVKGNCAEIARCFYYKSGSHMPITSANHITERVNGWHEIPFIQKEMAQWYDQTAEVASETGVDILDLFYWEHRMGSWQAQGQLEWDFINEAYTPYNYRPLLELLLSVPTKFRCAPDYILFEKIAQVLWPEILKEPVNPLSLTIKERLKIILRHFNVYNMTKKMHGQLTA